MELQLKKLIIESLKNFKPEETYFDSYSSAIESILDRTKAKGYTIEDEEVWNKISVGSKRPKDGETTRVSLVLHKDGKECKKMLHIQVYGMGKKYELNGYIN